MEEPLENNEKRELESRVYELERENLMLQKELAVKSVISEIFQYQGNEENVEEVYQRIITLISEIIEVDNFYVALLSDGFINIPYMVDAFDDFSPEMLDERTNPGLKQSLTAFALAKSKTLVLTEREIVELEEKGKIKLVGKIPKQWLFLPFHTENLEGGIVFQCYAKEERFSYKDMSMLAYVTMHIGNFLSGFTAKNKINQQYEELKATQGQLVHSEKMASIGQLAAGVAHEINNPLGYVNSNLNSLKEYIDDLNTFIGKLDGLANSKKGNCDADQEKSQSSFSKLKAEHDIDFILKDTNELISESIFGMDKVKKIVQGLKNFSHAGEEQMKKADINECIEETVRIVWNEIKYHCEIERNYSELPETYCHPSQLNQVFMNLLINAGHAIKENGLIKISTKCEDDIIYLEFKDNGGGIDEEHVSQLFNPFFTTKPVGQGTGLGLSISYGIIENHHGNIIVESEIGVGTCFKIKIPVVRELDPELIEESDEDSSSD